MFTAQQNQIIEDNMDLVKAWAIRFATKKNGRKVVDVEDYIQEAYIGLMRFVKKYGTYKPEDKPLLRLFVKERMYRHAHEMLGVSIPYSEFKRSYMEIEDRISSIDDLLSAVNNFTSGETATMSSLWGSGTEVSIEERIDLKDAASRMSKKLQRIYEMMSKGMSIYHIAKVNNRAFSSTHELVERIRLVLRREAHLDFLVPYDER